MSKDFDPCPNGHTPYLYDQVFTSANGIKKVICNVCDAETYPVVVYGPTGVALLLDPGWQDEANDERRIPKTRHRVAVGA